jgi:hypothetical protein
MLISDLKNSTSTIGNSYTSQKIKNQKSKIKNQKSKILPRPYPGVNAHSTDPRSITGDRCPPFPRAPSNGLRTPIAPTPFATCV